MNNSPTLAITTQINIAGMTAGQGGQKWTIEPAGSIISGGINIQDKGDISINGVVHPDPLTAPALPSDPFTSGNTFTVSLPASGMILLKIPAATGDTTPPAAPTGLTVTVNGFNIDLDWNNNTEVDLAGYNVYRSTTSGSGYHKLNGTVIASSVFTDSTAVSGETYYYKVTAIDTSWNESEGSNEVFIDVPQIATGTILREWWTGISGAAVSALTSNANYPNNPTGQQQISSFEGPADWAENYGTRIRGYIYPPTTGSYTFWIASDDNCQLWLSTDGSPAHASLIAQCHRLDQFPRVDQVFLTGIHAAHADGGAKILYRGPAQGRRRRRQYRGRLAGSRHYAGDNSRPVSVPLVYRPLRRF